MIDLTERLAENEQKARTIGARLQQLEQEKQQLLQELLRLDGEHRLLVTLQREAKADAADGSPVQSPNP